MIIDLFKLASSLSMSLYNAGPQPKTAPYKKSAFVYCTFLKNHSLYKTDKKFLEATSKTIKKKQT